MTIKNDIREEILKELQKNKRRKNKKSYREIFLAVMKKQLEILKRKLKKPKI